MNTTQAAPDVLKFTDVEGEGAILGVFGDAEDPHAGTPTADPDQPELPTPTRKGLANVRD